MRFLKQMIGLLLLPMCAALTLCALQCGQALAARPGSLLATPTLAFAGGYLLWLGIFIALPKPMRTYVLGHELTHMLWAKLFGAEVGGLEVGKEGGQVRTSKINWFIALAPYFFPFYAMLFIALFFLTGFVWNLTAYRWVLFFLVGLGWSFHVTFTLMILLTVRQPDVKSQGVVFSAVMIYLMNLLLILVTATALSADLTFLQLATGFGRNLLTCYGWTLDKLVCLWQYGAAWVQQRQH
jgi:hypothetical protein